MNVNAGLYGRRNFTALHLLISENTRHSPHDYEIECLAQLIERVSLLLQAGADTSLRDQDGFTPLDIAEGGKEELLRYDRDALNHVEGRAYDTALQFLQATIDLLQ